MPVQHPDVGWQRRWLVATYGYLGQIEDAEWEIMELDALGHALTIEDFELRTAISNDGYKKILLEGLRKAGVPER